MVASLKKSASMHLCYANSRKKCLIELRRHVDFFVAKTMTLLYDFICFLPLEGDKITVKIRGGGWIENLSVHWKILKIKDFSS